MTPEEFRELRKRLGMSQEDLAQLLGVRGVTISRWETSCEPISKMVVLAMRYVEILKTAKNNDTEF